MEFLYAAPWPIITWFGLIGAILTTFFAVPLWLKNSNTFFGIWYREMLDEDDDQEEQIMGLHATSRIACLVHVLSTFSFGLMIWWSGT